MKVLLINPLSQNSQWENDIIAKQPPCGLLYIASYLREFGHEVKLYERKFAVGFQARTAESILFADKHLYGYVENFSPDFVGITATTPQIMDAYRCTRLIKEFDEKIKIILGGPHPSAEPYSSFKQCKEIDAICIGEGENTMLEFVEGYPLRDIKGISFDDGGRTIINEKRALIQDLNKLPFPARDLLNADFYFAPSSTTIKGNLLSGTTIYTQRGCPNPCSFCQNSISRNWNSGRYVRQHSIDYVEAEIQHLIENYKIKALFFDDPVFAVEKNRTLGICNMLIRSKINKKIVYEVSLRADTVDEDILNVLKESGCINVIYGIESGSPDVLLRMNKNATVEDGLKAIKLTKKFGISCTANLILGTPHEREQDFIDSIKFLKNTRPDWITRHKFYPLPGTLFYKQLISEGRIKNYDDWDDLYDQAVLGDITFADIPYSRFDHLRLILDRTLVLPTNYLFKIKANIKNRPMYAIRQFFLMAGHVLSLYLPPIIRKRIERLAELLRIKSRYVYE